MKNELFFSVIVPTYNRAEYILDTVGSVLAQTYPHFELIVVDDGSTDNTAAVLETIADQRLIYFRKQNEERSIARNAGTAMAKGDYVTFLDSDDIFFPDHLETVATRLAESGNPAFFHSAYEIRNVSSGQTTSVSYPKNPDLGLTDGNFLSCQGIFLKRETALEYPFNPQLSFMEDWELWLRIVSKYQLVISEKVTSIVLDHSERSVVNARPQEIVSKVLLFLETVLANKEICKHFGRNILRLKASCYTYIALHVALTGKQKALSLQYLLKGIASNPASLLKRRAFAIVKHFIFQH